MMLASYYPCMLYHCFLMLSLHNHPETLILPWEPLQTRVSCWLGQPNSSLILPSGLIQMSTCLTSVFPVVQVIQTQAMDCTFTGLWLCSNFSSSVNLQRISLQFFGSFFFSYLSDMVLSVNIPLEEELYDPSSREGNIYRRLLLHFFLGFRHFFHKVFQDLSPTIKKKIILEMDNCAINKQTSQAVMNLILC